MQKSDFCQYWNYLSLYVVLSKFYAIPAVTFSAIQGTVDALNSKTSLTAATLARQIAPKAVAESGKTALRYFIISPENINGI
jgi:hypothetical protein